MKIRFTIITILAFLTASLFAQNHTTVYGNLGVENVNISVVNTQYGTSTDKKGHYELPIYDRTKNINLYYSCIGYADTIISITPRQLARDSVNISFKMRKQNYDIQEVGITASSDFYRSKPGIYIADIAFQKDKIFVLENRKKNQYCAC